MSYDPARHHRRSIRLRGYGYSLAGAYYVTIVTQDRAPLFGDVVDGVMQLNDAGRMVQTVWDEIPLFYPGVDIDAFVVMPNHIHGIIVLAGVGADPRVRPLGETDIGQPPEIGQPPAQSGQPRGVAPTDGNIGQFGQPRGVAPTLSLGDVISRFKTMTTKRYTDGVKQSGWPPYRGRVWQRNYYEHIIRDDPSLQRIRSYIESNPEQWAADRENPTAAYQGKGR